MEGFFLFGLGNVKLFVVSLSLCPSLSMMRHRSYKVVDLMNKDGMISLLIFYNLFRCSRDK